MRGCRAYCTRWRKVTKVTNPISDFTFLSTAKSGKSRIQNPFLDSPKGTHPRLHFFQLDREFFCLLPTLARLYSATASPSERLRSDGSLATNFPLSFTEGRNVSVIFAWHWRSLLFFKLCLPYWHVCFKRVIPRKLRSSLLGIFSHKPHRHKVFKKLLFPYFSATYFWLDGCPKPTYCNNTTIYKGLVSQPCCWSQFCLICTETIMLVWFVAIVLWIFPVSFQELSTSVSVHQVASRSWIDTTQAWFLISG